MKISTKGRYGLRALADLAVYSQGEPIALAMVAARQKISLNYLEQVFGQLRKAGLVRSIKGPSGGYLLAKPAKDITVKEILEVLEGPFSIVGEDIDRSGQDAMQLAIKSLVWDEIDARINEFMEKRTLEHLVNEYKSYQESHDMMYYI